MQDKQGIPIEITARQLKLLRTYLDEMDDDLARRINIAVKQNNGYIIHLQPDHIDELTAILDHLMFDGKSSSITEDYETLWEYFNELYVKFCPDEFMGEEMEDVDEDFLDEEIHTVSENAGPVYTLKVALVEDKRIWRTIAIRGGQTLHDLHKAIFLAFNRFDEHLYSFYLPSTMVKSFKPRTVFDLSVEYSHPYNLDESIIDMGQVNDAAQTRIDDLALDEKARFYYLFDFGDEWWHEITVTKTGGKPDNKTYPRLLEKKGPSPAQYGDDDFYDEDEDEWE